MISLRIGKCSIDSLSKISRGFWISNVHFSTSSKKPPIQQTNTSFEFLMQKHHFSPKTVSEIGPLLTRIKNPQNCDSLLSFFNEFGFSNHQVETIVKRWPDFLVCRLETNIKPKIKIFQDLGLPPREISEMISKRPWVLRPSMNSILLSLSVLRDLVGSDGEVAKLLKLNSWYLSKDLSKSLVPNVEYLVQCGVQLDQMIRLLYYSPMSLLISHKLIKRHVERADELGVDRSSKSFIHAVCVISKMKDRTWDMKLQAFRDIGFSDDDILRVFRQSPLVFAMSIQKLMRINEILLATGKYKMSSVLSCSTSLFCSIERWYKPRLKVLEILESKKLIQRWPTFSTMHRMSNITFFKKFVAPRLEEVGNVYMANMSSNDRKKLEDVLTV